MDQLKILQYFRNDLEKALRKQYRIGKDSYVVVENLSVDFDLSFIVVTVRYGIKNIKCEHCKLNFDIKDNIDFVCGLFAQQVFDKENSNE